MKFKICIVLIFLIKYIKAELIIDTEDLEEQKIDVITEIIMRNLKRNGWNNILFMGHLPDLLYHRLKSLPFTIAVTEIGTNDEQIEDVVPYNSNFIIMNCQNLEHFENAIKKIVTLPYWHPLSNIILNYHAPYDKETVAKIFYIFWYYKAINVVIVQYDVSEMLISHFSPYMSESYRLSNVFGCRTAKKFGFALEDFESSFICDTHCDNVTSYTVIRSNHLGTCLGFDTERVSLNNTKRVKDLSLLEDKGKNLHGFRFYAYTFEMLPFLIIKEYENGSYAFLQRDGMIWTVMAELLNFEIDVTPVVKIMKKPFNFEIQIPQIFSFANRKADLLLYPVYQQDLMVVQVDYAFPHMDSGLCILSHRAGFETVIFDVNFVEENMYIFIEFLICLFCTWFVFFIYNIEQKGSTSLDQAGKDLINTIKTALSLGLHNPPKQGSFRIFMMITMWCFFAINFSTQAAIISLFSVHKKEKEVDTFDDIIKKGYNIEGLTSPDVALPEMEEKFQIIISRMVTIRVIFGCVKKMEQDSRRFCLMDCSIGRYLERNMINKKGTQYLHIVSDARIHSHYLNMLLHKHSPLTDHVSRYIMILFEAGLIKKWMEYRYIDTKEEATVKPLGMGDLEGIFECYAILVGMCMFVFLIEVTLNTIRRMRQICKNFKSQNISLKSLLKNKIGKMKKFGKSDASSVSTQTV